MYRIFTLIFLVFLFDNGFSQNLKGQWKGEFYDKSTSIGSYSGDKCEYVLELDVNNNKIIGTSYTYFVENGKRYYTICKVEGTFDSKKKYAEITEVERTKTNIPSNVNNCFQIHKLTYFKQGNTETMEGNWIPAPNQQGNCGRGTTFLSKRTLINSYPNAANKINSKSGEISGNSSAHSKKENIITSPFKPRVKSEKTEKTIESKSESDNTEIGTVNLGDIDNSNSSSDDELNSADATKKLGARKSTLLKKIEVNSKTIKVDLYDNGEIDGDSISLFFNGKLLLSNKRLTDKAISLTLNIDDNLETNDLVMYAENLGTIPPNSALMVVTDGPNRYEIRIISDLKRSGEIQFVRKDSQ